MSSALNNLSSIDAELADRLENDDEFRTRYIRSFAQTEVATEIRELRRRRRLRQAEVASLAGTGQSAISRIEKADYDAWTFKTLLSIAEKLKSRLRITFEPIEVVASGYREQHQAAGQSFVVKGTETANAAVIEESVAHSSGISGTVGDVQESIASSATAQESAHIYH